MHQSQQTNKIGWKTGAAIVVANMIGTGAFTTLGFQVQEIQNSWSILLLWGLGGIMALSGAFCYAELASHFKRSGGEYQYLSKAFHPILGYLSGWISITVGFTAPVALAAMALAAYMEAFWQLPAKWIAIVTVLAISIIHSISIQHSSRFQNSITLLKVVLIGGFVAAGLFFGSEATALDFSNSWQGEFLQPSMIVALVFVSYAYSGWNAAAYVAEEIEDVSVNLPKALIRGTALVTLVYLFLQYIFLKHATLEQLAGKVEVGQIVATQLFGEQGGLLISYAIAFFLISSISAMVWVGPRVGMVMAQDYKLWEFLKPTTPNSIPIRAIWFNASISVGMILTSTFDQVLLYCGLILQLLSALTVIGLIIVRRREGDQMPYRSPLYPLMPITFLLISAWILSCILYERPFESILGLTNIALGLLTYWVSKKMKRN